MLVAASASFLLRVDHEICLAKHEGPLGQGACFTTAASSMTRSAHAQSVVLGNDVQSAANVVCCKCYPLSLVASSDVIQNEISRQSLHGKRTA
jgi:hypothetical protein